MGIQTILKTSRPRWTAPEGDAVLHIGLVNNMPDGALEQTEQQFFRLLQNASPNIHIRWHLFSLNTIARGEQGRLHLMHQNYRGLRELFSEQLHGLIVTGTEPLKQNLSQETYWSELGDLFDWIAQDGPPAIFSCLAAHAAVLHYDGIARRRLPQKRFGVFDHIISEPHPLVASVTSPVKVAHSRWNEVSADALEGAGYQVLTYAPEAGADLFVKQKRNLLLFFQGHPEYETDTLAREYRRDVRRYLGGDSDIYPEFPAHYFCQDDLRALKAFRESALTTRNETQLEDFPPVAVRAPGGERSTLAPLFANWLRYLESNRAERVLPPPKLARIGLPA